MKLHEIWHSFNKRDLFSKIVDEFMRNKLRYSAWPEYCGTPSQKLDPLQNIQQIHGITWSLSKIETNLTGTLVAKLMLNLT